MPGKESLCRPFLDLLSKCTRHTARVTLLNRSIDRGSVQLNGDTTETHENGHDVP
jgi:hypothetical protein